MDALVVLEDSLLACRLDSKFEPKADVEAAVVSR